MFIILDGLLPFREFETEQFPLLLLALMDVPSMITELIFESVWLLADIDVEGEADKLKEEEETGGEWVFVLQFPFIHIVVVQLLLMQLLVVEVCCCWFTTVDPVLVEEDKEEEGESVVNID